jgi:hypothetical protein
LTPDVGTTRGSGRAKAGTRWPDEVEEVLAADLVPILATATPARGAVLSPIANIGLRDRDAATVTVTTSLGLWRKLERIQREPRVALAFHARGGRGARPEHVLLQGRASFSWTPDRDWLESIGEHWERSLETRELGPIWRRWMHVYHWVRVGIEITVERIVVWPDPACEGRPIAYGDPVPADPAPQPPPARGTAPRVDPRRAAARLRRLPHVLLGWVGADGYPAAVPVQVGAADSDGIVLDASEGLVPPGARRAGLTGHWFTDRLVGQEQRVHTGWLEPRSGGRLLYSPHTEAGYRLPPTRFVHRAGSGFATRRGLRQGRRAGVFPEVTSK